MPGGKCAVFPGVGVEEESRVGVWGGGLGEASGMRGGRGASVSEGRAA